MPTDSRVAYHIPPVPARPWFRFSMRRMLAAMMVLSLVFAAISWQRSLAVHEASALLQIIKLRPFSHFKTEQRERILDANLLRSVVKRPEIGGLPLIKMHDDPVAWLRKELKVDYPGDATILRLSLRARGRGKRQAGNVVNAVVEAYLADWRSAHPSDSENLKLVRPARESFDDAGRNAPRTRSGTAC